MDSFPHVDLMRATLQHWSDNEISFPTRKYINENNKLM